MWQLFAHCWLPFYVIFSFICIWFIVSTPQVFLIIIEHVNEDIFSRIEIFRISFMQNIFCYNKDFLIHSAKLYSILFLLKYIITFESFHRKIIELTDYTCLYEGCGKNNWKKIATCSFKLTSRINRYLVVRILKRGEKIFT